MKVFQSRLLLYPAYLNSIAAMRPVTKVRILGFRLGMVILVAYWLAIFAGTHLPEIPQILAGTSDKIKHFGAFFGLSLLLCYVTNGDQVWRRFGGILLLGATYGAIDELTQGLVPGRTTDLYDWAADVSGMSSGIVVYLALRFCHAKYRDRQSFAA